MVLLDLNGIQCSHQMLKVSLLMLITKHSRVLNEAYACLSSSAETF